MRRHGLLNMRTGMFKSWWSYPLSIHKTFFNKTWQKTNRLLTTSVTLVYGTSSLHICSLFFKIKLSFNRMTCFNAVIAQNVLKLTPCKQTEVEKLRSQWKFHWDSVQILKKIKVTLYDVTDMICWYSDVMI